MASARFAAAGAALGGAVYVAGGYDGGGYLATAERLDPREGRWQKLPDMAAARGAHAMAALGGAVYALGGYDSKAGGGMGFPAPVERFDARAGWWEAAAPLAYGWAAALEGRLVVGGGQTDDAGRSSPYLGVDLYDAAADAWAPARGAPPAARFAASVCVVDAA
jgi:hypothetical protein